MHRNYLDEGTDTIHHYGHFSFSISLMERLIRENDVAKGHQQTTIVCDGKPVSNAEALEWLAAERARGREWLTSADCDNVRPDGGCGGHKGEPNQGSARMLDTYSRNGYYGAWPAYPPARAAQGRFTWPKLSKPN